MPPSQAPKREPLDLLGGRVRLVFALLIGFTFIANPWINRRVNQWFAPPRASSTTPWKVGEEAEVQITVISADQNRLDCAHNAVVEGKHCDFSANHRRWPRRLSEPFDNNREQVIQPYRTADTNKLVLIAGLWAQPELAYRVHQEPTRLYPVKKQLRFVAYCRVKFTGKLENAELRWNTTDKWQKGKTALVAEPLHCTLTNPNKQS